MSNANELKKTLKMVLKPIGVWGAIKAGRTMVNRITGKTPFYKADWECERSTLGDRYARFCVCPKYLSESSIIYSFGCGDNISFDLELIKRYKAAVFAFDPTPRSIDWLHKQELPENFYFYDVGLGAYNGLAGFAPPENPDHVSFTMSGKVTEANSMIQATIYRLGTIMKMLEHDHIDLLKIDIEGSEYDVLKDIVNSDISIGQLLVEFHHGINGITYQATTDALAMLRDAGYKLFDVSAEQREFSFINPDLAGANREYEKLLVDHS